MKNIISNTTILCTLSVAVLFSCKKHNTNTITPNNDKLSLNQLFAGLRSTPQNLSVTAGRDTIVYGTQGTKLHFYTNSFKDADGNTITSGTVSLQLIEMYKPGDMIANRTTTTANGQMLASGGEVNINATMNGQQVFANKYGIGFHEATPVEGPMTLFYGTARNADSITSWSQADTNKNGTWTNGTTIDTSYLSGTTANLYSFDSCTNFIWANCDWFYYTDSPKVTVSVILPDTTFNATNTQLFLVMHNISGWAGTGITAVLSNVEDFNLGGASYTAATNTLILVNEDNKNIAPAGTNYDLVVIAGKNGQYYYYKQSGTLPHDGLTATAVMTPQSQSYVAAQLAAL